MGDQADIQVKNFSKRLKSAIENAGGFSEVEKNSGIPATTISRYQQGSPNLKFRIVCQLAEACHVTPEWLLAGKLPEITSEHAILDPNTCFDFVDVPYYDVHASAGYGCCQPDEYSPPVPSEYFKIPAKLLTKIALPLKDTMLLETSGDSMEPTIRSGDKLLIDTRPSSLSGIFVICLEGNIFVKRLSITPKNILISSDNAVYPPFEVSKQNIVWGAENATSEDLIIIGRVMHFMRSCI